MVVMMFATVTAMAMLLALVFLESTLGEGSFGIHSHRIHLVVKTFDELPRGNELGL
jgi:hypothetical protein